MTAVEVTIDAREVDALLSTVERKFRTRTVNRGLRHAAKIVAQAARGGTPRDTGTLRKALKVRRLRSYGRRVLAIGAIFGRRWFTGPTFYAAFVEWGHGIGDRSSGQRAAQRFARLAPDVQAARQTARAKKGLAPFAAAADTRKRVPARLMLTNAARMTGRFALAAGVGVMKDELEKIRKGKGLDRGEEVAGSG